MRALGWDWRIARGTRTPKACWEKQDACVDRLGDNAATEFADVFESARLTHEASAPRFDTAEACRAATGTECTPLAAGPNPAGTPWAFTAASVFIPAMAGVVIGRILADGTRGATPVYAGIAPPPCLPASVLAIAGCVPTSSSSTGGSGSSGSGGGGPLLVFGLQLRGIASDQAGRAGISRVTASSQGEGFAVATRSCVKTAVSCRICSADDIGPRFQEVTIAPLSKAETARLEKQASALRSPTFGACEVKQPAQFYALDAEQALIIRPCYQAFQGSSIVMTVSRSGGSPRPVSLVLPGVSPAAKDGPDMVDPEFDPARGTLSTTSKGRGIADCGSSEVWVWSTGAFRILSLNYQEQCGGAEPGDWPPLFRSRKS